MKASLGVLICLIGVGLGFYVGGWVLFVGGIVDIIEAFRAETLIAVDMGVGILKVISASLVGSICFWVCFAFGAVLIND